MNTIIESHSNYIPRNKISSQDMEEKISKYFSEIPFGILEEMTGVKTRYFVDDGEYASDLAIKAAENCFEKSSIKKQDIDLLIFASASQDIIEPATGNIVQAGLGLSCPVFDVKNACNSFLNGIDIADSFIKSGKYKNILVCSGESPSKVIKFNVKNRLEFKKHFASYTFGDAGAAMILTCIEGKKGIQKTYFESDGNYWELGTIMGGGSRFPQDVEKNYFVGNPGALRDKFRSIKTEKFENILNELGWEKQDITKVFVHQVAMSNFEYLQEILGIEKEKFEIILPEYGNIASCCIPTSFEKYTKNNILERGDKFVFMGFASGYSYGFIFYEV